MLAEKGKTMREKLIELLDDIQQCGEGFTEYEIYGMRLPDTVSNEDIADHLIANGVRLETKQATSEKTSDESKRWIPVTERLPEKAADYICRCTVNDFDDMPFYMVLRYIVYDKNPHFQHETKGGMKVTHWMLLPEPPKEVE